MEKKRHGTVRHRHSRKPKGQSDGKDAPKGEQNTRHTGQGHADVLGTGQVIFEGHNQLQWAKVRKRAILQQSTQADWENANTFQRQVMHQIELAVLSVTEDDYEEE